MSLRQSQLTRTDSDPSERKLIDLFEVKDGHPVKILGNAFAELLTTCEPQHLPPLDQFVAATPAGAWDYCSLMVPIPDDPYIDFVILDRGKKTMGNPAQIEHGMKYSEEIVPHLLPHRLMELASALAMKACRISTGFSARHGAVNVRVYRGVFPVWLEDRQHHGVVLCVAPLYAEITSDVGRPENSHRE